MELGIEQQWTKLENENINNKLLNNKVKIEPPCPKLF